MRFQILGGLEVIDERTPITPTAPKLRTLLSILVLSHDEVVTRSTIVDELWGDEPPDTNVMTLNTYVYQLRRIFKGDRSDGGDVVHTKPCGYLLETDPGALDLEEFREKVAAGRAALEAGDLQGARFALHQAVLLHRGEALSGVECGPFLRSCVAGIEDEYLEATRLRIDVDLACGLDRELVGELRSLTGRYRLHEGMHAQLMIALYRSDRRCEALAAYAGLRSVLLDELGIEPSPRLRQVHQDVLCDAEWLQPARTSSGWSLACEAPVLLPSRAVAL